MKYECLFVLFCFFFFSNQKDWKCDNKNQNMKMWKLWCVPLKFSSSFGRLFASQAGVSRTGFAINGDFSTSLLPPSKKKKTYKWECYKYHVLQTHTYSKI